MVPSVPLRVCRFHACVLWHYIPRLVIENQDALSTFSPYEGELPHATGQHELRVDSSKAAFQNAQSEAAEWRSPSVKIWKPTPLDLRLIERTQVGHWKEEQEYESITVFYGIVIVATVRMYRSS